MPRFVIFPWVLLCASAVACDDGTAEPACGDGVCHVSESSASCPTDCPGNTFSCGDGSCDAGETAETCAADCGAAGPECGNGACETGETAQSCAADCAAVSDCGNGTCDDGETTANCPADCTVTTVCGNDVCEVGESAAGCPQDCETTPECGDGTCDASETEANCPADCGAAGGCSEHADCGPTEACLQDMCEAALDRSYTITMVSAEVGTQRPDGDSWDSFGGAPDLKAEFGLQGADPCVTEAGDDAFTATWNASCEFVLGSGDTFEVTLIDEDPALSDTAAQWTWSTDAELVELARATDGTVTVQGPPNSDITLTFTVVPVATP